MAFVFLRKNPRNTVNFALFAQRHFFSMCMHLRQPGRRSKRAGVAGRRLPDRGCQARVVAKGFLQYHLWTAKRNHQKYPACGLLDICLGSDFPLTSSISRCAGRWSTAAHPMAKATSNTALRGPQNARRWPDEPGGVLYRDPRDGRWMVRGGPLGLEPCASRFFLKPPGDPLRQTPPPRTTSLKNRAL